MLRDLHIRNLGVVAEASVSFTGGLNVVTGETGAGKTLLVSSLGLLLGGRGSARLVAHGAPEASIEAVLEPSESTCAVMTERGLDLGDDELVVARRISAEGRSRAWVAGQLVPISVLGEVCSTLIEIHGQEATFTLAEPGAQLDALDAFADSHDLRHRYGSALERLREVTAEREELVRSERERARETDFLRFQIAEIEGAELEPDEDEAIAQQIGRLTHAERLTEAGQQAVGLTGSDGAAGSLSEAHEVLDGAARLDPSVAPLAERVDALAAEAAEVAWDIHAWAEGIEADPRQLEVLQERAAVIGSLQRKYGDTVADVLDACAEARRRLASLEGADERLASLDERIASLTAEVETAAERLSRRRKEASSELAELVAAELPALAMPHATFEVRCVEHGELRTTGRERVEFLLSANPDAPPDRIDRVASGGELARTMIALALALTRSQDARVVVFDEADRGVGGQAALEVAKRLARLGSTRQVLVVSHLPQVAAFGDHHIRVRKEAGDVTVDVLEETERLEELSRMLAGLQSSETARAHAAELLDMAAAKNGVKA